MPRALRHLWQLYFSWKGRVSPLVFFLASLVAWPYVSYYFSLQDKLSQATSDLDYLYAFLVGIPLMWASACLIVKRLHDFNFHGIWYFFMLAMSYMMPYLLPFGGQMVGPLLVLFIAGDDGKNRFGPAPFGWAAVLREVRVFQGGRLFIAGRITAEEYNRRCGIG